MVLFLDSTLFSYVKGRVGSPASGGTLFQDEAVLWCDTLKFGGYGVSTLFNLEVTVSPHSQLGVLSSYGELRDGFPPTLDLLNRCFVICFSYLLRVTSWICFR